MDNRRLVWGLMAIYVALFAWISTLERSSFYWLLLSYSLLFALYFYGLKARLKLSFPLAIMLIAAVRICLMFELPALSDDFYRFLWDGMLLNEGLNPFGRIPSEQYLDAFDDPNFAKLLLQNMNSPHYASVYPTFHQAIFGLAYFFSGSSLLNGVNGMRAIIITIELIFFLYLFFKRGVFKQLGLAYFLNPLVIIEGVGNVHFEAVMVPILGYTLIEARRRRYFRSAISFASAILVKLTPTLIGPLLLFRFSTKGRLQFLIVSAVVVIIFAGMMEPWLLFQTFENGLGLYFSSFEFNASVYYLLNAFIALFTGYNPIAITAPFLGLVCFVLICLISYKYRKANIFELALVVYLCYLLLSTTIHPWYLLPVVFLAVFSNRSYILIWSFCVWFSYSHYLGEPGPKWGFIFAEYLLLFAALLLENYREKWLQPVLRG